MSKKITLAADLTGGGQVARELEGIGQSGKAALRGLEDAAKALNSTTGRLRSGFSDLGKAWGPLQESFGRLGAAARTFGRNMAIAQGAAVAAGAAITGVAKSAADAADSQIKAARAVGLTVEQYGRLAFAAEQSGVEQAAMTNGLARFNKLIAEAGAGSKTATATFQRMGVPLRDTAGRLRSTEDVLGDVADVFATLPNGVQKTALAMQIFGRSGAGMVSFLNSGRAGLQALGDQADALGITFTQAEATLSENFNDTLDRLGRSFIGIKNSLGLVFMPALIEAADAITAFVTANRQAIAEFAGLQWERVAAVVRDLIALAQGRDMDVRNGWIIGLRDQVVTFGQAFHQVFTGLVFPVFEAFMGVLNGVAAMLNGVFGTELSGQAIALGLVVGKLSGAFGLMAAAVATVGPAVRAATAAFAGARVAVTVLTASMAGLSVATLANPFVLAALAIGAAVAVAIGYWDELKDLMGFAAKRAATAADEVADATLREAEAARQSVEAREQMAALTKDLAADERAFAQAIEHRTVAAEEGEEAVTKALATMKAAYGDLQKTLDGTLDRQIKTLDKLAEASKRDFRSLTTQQRIQAEADLVTRTERQKAEAVRQWSARSTEAVRAHYSAAIALNRQAGNDTTDLNRQMLADLGAINQRREQELSATVDRLIAEEHRRRDAAVAAAEDAASKIKAINASVRDLELSLLSPEKQYRAKEADIRGKKAQAQALLAAGEFEKAKALAEEIAADAIANASTAETTKRTVAAARKSAEFAKQLIQEATAGIVAAEQRAADGAAQQARQLQGQLSLVQQQIGQIRAAEAQLAGMKVILDVSQAVDSLRAVQEGLATTKGRVMETAAAFDSLAASANRAGAAMRSANGGSSSGTEDAPGYAGGGAIVGPGTGTSDSILMWGSNGEFVQRARAVRAAGVDFMAALNRVRSRSDFTRLIQSVANAAPRFANGGLLQLPSPTSIAAGLSNRLTAGLTMPTLNPVMPDLGALAAAGSGGRPLNIYLPGGERVQVTAQEHEARKLERLSNGLGRGPRWVGVGK